MGSKIKNILIALFVFLSFLGFGEVAYAFNPLVILKVPFIEDIAKVALKSVIKNTELDEYLPDSVNEIILDPAPKPYCTGLHCVGKALPALGGLIGAFKTRHEINKELKAIRVLLKKTQYTAAMTNLLQATHLEMRLREIQQEIIQMREEGRENYAHLVNRSKKAEERLSAGINEVREEQQKILRGQIRAAYSCIRGISQNSPVDEIVLCKNKISDLRHRLVEYQEGIPYVFELASFEFDLNLFYQPSNAKAYQQLLKEVASVPTRQELKRLKEQISCLAPKELSELKSDKPLLVNHECTPRVSWFAEGMHHLLNKEDQSVPELSSDKDLYLVRERLLKRIRSYLGSDFNTYAKKDMLEFARVLIEYQYDRRRKELEESKANTLIYSISLQLPELKNKTGHWQMIADVPFMVSQPLNNDETESKRLSSKRFKVDRWSKLKRNVLIESMSSDPPTEMIFKWMEDPYLGGWTYDVKFTCTVQFDQAINQYVIYDPSNKITSRCGLSDYMISYQIHTKFKL